MTSIGEQPIVRDPGYGRGFEVVKRMRRGSRRLAMAPPIHSRLVVGSCGCGLCHA